VTRYYWGARLREIFAASWPTDAWIEREGDFAERTNSLPSTWHQARSKARWWTNSTLLEGDIAEAVAALKEQPGQDILMYASVELMHTLIEHDLIDEYRLWLHPLVLGSGKRLFHDGIDKTALEFIQTTTLPNGVVVLSYRPSRNRKPA
jgi:dihydrofolate reductase